MEETKASTQKRQRKSQLSEGLAPSTTVETETPTKHSGRGRKPSKVEAVVAVATETAATVVTPRKSRRLSGSLAVAPASPLPAEAVTTATLRRNRKVSELAVSKVQEDVVTPLTETPAAAAGTPRKGRRLSQTLPPAIPAAAVVVVMDACAPAPVRNRKVSELADSDQLVLQGEAVASESTAGAGTPRKSRRLSGTVTLPAGVTAEVNATPPRNRKVSERSAAAVMDPGTPTRKSRRLSGSSVGGWEEAGGEDGTAGGRGTPLPLTPAARTSRRRSSCSSLDIPPVILEEAKPADKEEPADSTTSKMEVIVEIEEEETIRVIEEEEDASVAEAEQKAPTIINSEVVSVVQKSEKPKDLKKNREDRIVHTVVEKSSDDVSHEATTRLEEDSPTAAKMLEPANKKSTPEAVANTDEEGSNAVFVEDPKTNIVARTESCPAVDQVQAETAALLQAVGSSSSSSSNKENLNRKPEGTKTAAAVVVDPLEALQQLMLPQVPRQKPKSGKFWKADRSQFRAIRKDKGPRKTFEQRLKTKEEILRAKELASTLIQAKVQAKQEFRRRIEENKKRREEREKAAEVYQVVRNPNKIKKLKRRDLVKRDILGKVQP